MKRSLRLLVPFVLLAIAAVTMSFAPAPTIAPSIAPLMLPAFQSTPAPTPGPGPTESGDVCPQRGGTLTVVHALSPTGLDHFQVDPGAEGIYILDQVMEGLLRYDEKFGVIPALAQDWSISPDGKTYNFKLRKDVKFHSGDPVTADDVLYSMARLMDPKGGPEGARHRAHVDRVEKVNDYEVNIILKEAWPPYPVFLGTANSYVANKKFIEKTGDKYGYSAVDGFGPFKFKEWVRDDHLTIVRNENYYRKGMPCVDQIIYRVITDPGVVKINLETGAVNVLQDPPMELISEFLANKALKVESARDSAMYNINMSMSHPPFNDVRVRQALNKAIDRQEIAKVVFGGYAEPAGGFFPSHFWAFDSGLKFPYDPEGAKKLLADAGYGASKPLKFTMIVYNVPPYTDIGQLVQAQLKKLGVDMQVQPLDKATALAVARGASGQDRTKMDAALMRHIPYNVSDDYAANKFATWGSQNTSIRYNLPDGVQNAKAEELFKQVVSLSDYVEADRAKMLPIYRQLEKMVLVDDAAQIITVIQDNLNVMRGEVMNFPTAVDDEVPLYRVWIKK